MTIDILQKFFPNDFRFTVLKCAHTNVDIDITYMYIYDNQFTVIHNYDRICKMRSYAHIWFWKLEVPQLHFVSELLGRTFYRCKCNDRTVLLPNFKAVGQTQAELHSLKVEKLYVYIRPLLQIRSHLWISNHLQWYQRDKIGSSHLQSIHRQI